MRLTAANIVRIVTGMSVLGLVVYWFATEKGLWHYQAALVWIGLILPALLLVYVVVRPVFDRKVPPAP